MRSMKIMLFGPPAIDADGERLDPGRRKVTALAAYLAASETAQSREGICAILWPEKSDETARAELRRTISSLRSCIGPDLIEATRSRVTLSPRVWVDVREFRALTAAVEAHHPNGKDYCPDCVRALERAVALYRGDFLAGFSLTDSSVFDDWMVFETERLRDALGIALDRLSRIGRSAGEGIPRHSRAMAYARRWLQLDDLNEAAHRRIMTLHALEGQRSAALRQYEKCERLLDRELGTMPSAATVELKREIERGAFEPVADGANVPLPPAIAERPRRRRRVAVAAAAAIVVSAALGLLFVISPSRHREGSGIPIAVLPLADNSSDSHNQWFVAGMTEAITTDLAKIHALRVVSRSSAEVLAGSRPTVPQIRDRLGVDYVVEGSVLRTRNRVRITAQLVDARSDHHVWADEYESDLTDIIRLQGRISSDIALQVSARLSADERESLARSRPVDPDAYEAYLLGAYELGRIPFDIDSAPKCRENLERSVERDPGYAPAHAALANYYWGATQFGLYSNEEGMRLAESEAELAVALDSSLAAAHTVLGFVRFLHDFDWQGSEREFRRAVSLKPSSAEAHCWYGSLLCSVGRFNQAIAEVTRAREIDPLSLVNILNVAMRLYYARDFDGAIKQAAVAREMEADFYMSHLVLGYAYTAKGSYDTARAELETAAALAGDAAMEPLALLSYVYNREGRSADAEAAVRRFDALQSKGLSLSPLLRAYIPLGRGDYAAAMDMIDDAYAAHDLNLAWNFQDPLFDPLRTLPRFDRLRRAMKL